MPSTHIVKTCPILRTPRLQQIESIFDVPIAERSTVEWDVSLPIEDREWSIGLIVGPSGSGKTTVARSLFPEHLRIGYTDWPENRSVVDSFPQSLSIKTITETLNSVGFSSPPNWLRPFSVLSTGEQFRVTAARALLESSDLVVLDEFTSVVDRQVAQVASHCIQRSVRKTQKKFIAVTCHYDVLDWLQPDWVYQPHSNNFSWRYLQRHPELEFSVYRIDSSAWKMFKDYHYLSSDLHPAAQCFGAFIRDECVAFASYIHFPHPRTKNIKQGHRLVVRPDYQGLGLGGKIDDWVGEYLFALGYRFHITAAHPARIAYCLHSPRWKQLGANKASDGKQFHSHAGSVSSGPRAHPSLRKRQAQLRRLNTVSFEYAPEKTL